MTTNTAAKKVIASPPAPTPPRGLPEDPTASDDPNVKQAVEKDTSVIDAREGVDLETDEPVAAPDHDSRSRLDPDNPDFDILKALTAEGEREKEEKKERLTATSEALLAQNKYLIRKMADLHKYTIDRMVLPPPLTLCVACGAADQKPGGSEKKKSKSSGPNVHFIIRRTLRVVSVLLLLSIAVQLALIRGEGVADGRSGRNGKRMGIFAR